MNFLIAAFLMGYFTETSIEHEQKIVAHAGPGYASKAITLLHSLGGKPGMLLLYPAAIVAGLRQENSLLAGFLFFITWQIAGVVAHKLPGKDHSFAVQHRLSPVTLLVNIGAFVALFLLS